MRTSVAALTRLTARGSAALLQAVTIGLLARSVSPASFGIFSQVYSLATLAAVASGFGLSTYLLRIGSTKSAVHVQTTAALLRMATLTILAAAAILLALQQDWWSVIVAAGLASACGDALVDQLQAGLAGRHRHQQSSAVIVGSRLLPPVIILTGRAPSSAIIATAVAVFALAVVILVRDFSAPAPARAVIADARGYWASALLGTVSLLDTTVLRAVAGPTVAGQYAVANRLAGPLNVVSNSVVGVFLPTLADAEPGHRRRQARRLVLLCAVSGVLLAAVSPLLAWLAVRFLGPQYAGAYWAIVAAVIAAGLSGVTQILHAIQFVVAGTRLVVVTMLVGQLGMLLVLFPWLAPRYGATGAAVGLLLAQVVMLVPMLVALRRSVFGEH